MRNANRIVVHLPTEVEVVSQRKMDLHPNLAAVYERVNPALEMVGRSFPAQVLNLSTNGAFLAGHPLPLLSRIGFTFALDGQPKVEVVGWVMWRRIADCDVPTGPGGSSGATHMIAGFGVLFESIPFSAAAAIDRLAHQD